MHPFYRQATSLVGRPVYVHANGRVHYGILHSVTTDGVYLRSLNRQTTVKADHADPLNLDPLLFTDTGNIELEEVFWPFFFLPWLAIGALGPWWW